MSPPLVTVTSITKARMKTDAEAMVRDANIANRSRKESGAIAPHTALLIGLANIDIR